MTCREALVRGELVLDRGASAVRYARTWPDPRAGTAHAESAPALLLPGTTACVTRERSTGLSSPGFAARAWRLALDALSLLALFVPGLAALRLLRVVKWHAVAVASCEFALRKREIVVSGNGGQEWAAGDLGR